MNDDVQAPRPKPKWDLTRKVTAWAGLLEIPVMIAVLLLVGQQFAGNGPSDAAVTTLLVGTMAPGVLAGLISGGRFLDLYSGYAERIADPTAQLSPEQRAEGAAATSGVIGDGLWGSLIGGVALAIPATVAGFWLFNVGAIILLPLFVLIGAIAWFTGWAIGAVASLILCTAVGIAIGASRRPGAGRRLPWYLLSAFLPVLLVAVALPGAGTVVNGSVNVWAGILLALGVPVAGAEFVLGDGWFVVARIAVWLAIALLAAVIAVVVPSLLRRSGTR